MTGVAPLDGPPLVGRETREENAAMRRASEVRSIVRACGWAGKEFKSLDMRQNSSPSNLIDYYRIIVAFIVQSSIHFLVVINGPLPV